MVASVSTLQHYGTDEYSFLFVSKYLLRLIGSMVLGGYFHFLDTVTDSLGGMRRLVRLARIMSDIMVMMEKISL